MSAPEPVTTLARVDRFWLPIDDRPVVDYFNRHLFVPHQLRERLTASARRLAIREHRLLPRSPESTAHLSCAVETDLGDAAPVHRARLAIDRLLQEPSALPTAEGDSTPIASGRWILIEDGTRRNRSIVLLFSSARPHPTLALKIAPADSKGLIRERQALQHLDACLSAELAATLPRPGALLRQGEWQILPLSIVDGRPAYTEMQGSWQPSRFVAGHLEAAARWLARFHRETVRGSVFQADSAEWSPIVDQVRHPPGAGSEKASRVVALLARCRGYSIPLCAAHGDYWARNVLVSGDAASLPGVIDWERFRVLEAPFVDLFHFAVTYGLNYPWFLYRRLEPLAALHRTFIEDNPVSKEIRRYFLTYCEEGGLEPEWLRDLFELYLLRLSAVTGPDDLAWKVRSHPDPTTWRGFHRLLSSAGAAALSF